MRQHPADPPPYSSMRLLFGFDICLNIHVKSSLRWKHGTVLRVCFCVHTRAQICYRHSKESLVCVCTLWKVRKSTQLISGRQRGIYYTSSIITCSIMQDAYSAARTRTHHPFLFNTFHWIRLLPAPRTRNVRRFCEFQTSKKEIFWKFSFHQGIPS